MKLVDLFPTPIFGEIIKDIPPFQLEEYSNFILNEEQVSNGEGHGHFTKNQQLLNNNLFSKLNKNILNLSKIYLKEIGHDFEDLQIINSWGNVLQPGESIPQHPHSNSYISGTFYLTPGSGLQFHSEFWDSWLFVPKLADKANHTDFKYGTSNLIPIHQNLLLLFPSFLPHSVPLTNYDKVRLSIAFNIIPKGEFGPITGKLFLK